MDRHTIPLIADGTGPSPAIDRRDQDLPFTRPAPVRPPDGAPNVLLVMLDDVGFGASSAFGGPCRMPAAERLAAGGLTYTRFHTTALCSPTRAATLTGRNHHAVGMGLIAEQATAAPGYNGTRPASAATVARVLQGNGYATGAFGKMHQTPPWEISEAGPFDRWPVREGFDRFYGFLGAESDQYSPVLYQDFTPVHPPRTPEQGYHLSEDLVDRAAAWIDSVSTLDPDKPWLCYLPFGACHAPLHVPESHRDRYRGEFDHGWDRQREITLQRQKELGVVPPETELAPWAPGLPHWDECDDDQRTVAARLMELYAAFLEHTDDQVGRLIDHLDATGALDNTLVIYMIGDNGASAEGGMEGSFNYLANVNGLPTTARESLEHFDQLGTPHSYPHYPASWAMAMDTPYQWTKQAASHYGGTRNGLIVHWPKGITEPGLRHQWHHCVDITPTILEAAGIPAPHTVDGVAQQPMAGTPMNYTFDDPDAEDRHVTQYFEIFGNRGIHHRGWTAVALHRAPWLMATRGLTFPPLSEDRWELYDTTTDWSQARDLADEHPDILARLQERFLVEAARNQVLPIDDRTVGRNVAGEDVPPRPGGGARSLTLYPHMHGLPEKAAPRLFNTSYTLTAHLDAPEGGGEGVLAGFGGRFGGLALYVLGGVPVFCYTFTGGGSTHLRAGAPLAAGEHHVVLEFAYDGGGAGCGGTAVLRIDGEEAGTARIERTTPGMFSLNEQFDVGVHRGSPVSEDYADRGPFPYSGVLRGLRVDLPGDGVELPAGERRRMELAVH